MAHTCEIAVGLPSPRTYLWVHPEGREAQHRQEHHRNDKLALIPQFFDSTDGGEQIAHPTKSPWIQ
eukprot:9888899-Alexandrium_andersonii.AAC.1